jgi:signal transduction histidine kinase
MKPLGIRARILLVALAPAALVAFLVSALLVTGQIEQAQTDQHRRLLAVARQVAATAEYQIFVGNTAGLVALLDTVTREPDVVAGAILDPDGRVLAATVPERELPNPAQIHEGFEPPPASEKHLHWHGIYIGPTHLAERDLFEAPGTSVSQPIGRLLLRVSDVSMQEDLRRLVMTAISMSALILAFGVLLALALSGDMIRLLLRIRTVVDQVGHGVGGVRIRHSGQDELGHLAQGIDSMAERVEVNQVELAFRISDATAALRREKEEAVEAARSRSRFFAAASHDLRQPVQALKLFTARLENDARLSPLLPRIRQVGASVASLQELLATLLDYSRLSGQVYRTELHPVSAEGMIDLTIREFSAAAAAKGLDLRQHVVPCWLMTDPALFRRILINLVGNAIKHTRKGGVLVSCRHNMTHARIEVWDTGPGIPADQHVAIFDELVQLDNPERDASKGLGLGLSIVRRTTDLLSHPISLRSRVGSGSCFSLTIPLAPAPPDAEIDGEASLHAYRILVCGAPSAKRDELVGLLTDWDYEFAIVPDATVAIRHIANLGAPALLLLETGGDLSAALDEIDWIDNAVGRAIPALLIHPGPATPADPRAAHPTRHILTRPFRPGRLRALLDHLLEMEDVGE